MLNKVRNVFSIGFKEAKKRKLDLVILGIATISLIASIVFAIIEFSNDLMFGIIMLLISILGTLGSAYQRTIKPEDEITREKWKQRLGRIDYPGNWWIISLTLIGFIVLVPFYQKGFWNGIITLNPIPVSTQFRFLLGAIAFFSYQIMGLSRKILFPNISYSLARTENKPLSKPPGIWFLYVLSILVFISFGLVAAASPVLVMESENAPVSNLVPEEVIATSENEEDGEEQGPSETTSIISPQAAITDLISLLRTEIENADPEDNGRLSFVRETLHTYDYKILNDHEAVTTGLWDFYLPDTGVWGVKDITSVTRGVKDNQSYWEAYLKVKWTGSGTKADQTWKVCVLEEDGIWLIDLWVKKPGGQCEERVNRFTQN
jgi:hypothetical protein